MMKALVNIQTASPGPSIVALPRGLVGTSLLINAVDVPLKSEELVGGSAIRADQLALNSVDYTVFI